MSNASDACKTAFEYTKTFYPLWFTYNQSLKATPDQLIGPEDVDPLYQTVVAINVDTLYASSYLDLSQDPAVLSIPPAQVTFSVLMLDPYGNVFDPPSKFQSGLYVLVGPHGYNASEGPLPAGATVIQLPIDHPTMIFRADKYAANGADQTSAAETFRRSLGLLSLTNYNAGKSGAPMIVPEVPVYTVPFKTIADAEMELKPLAFLRQLMTAVSSPRTPPLSNNARQLSDALNALYQAADSNDDLAAGVVAAHKALIANYLHHQDANKWISFQNIGHWGDATLDRASITEFILYGNDFDSAAYFHVFEDSDGKPLTGKDGQTYAIHFAAKELPQAQRFWSITAYTPESVELVPNGLNKYNVATYTPGLQYESNGSLTIYIGTTLPAGVPQANFLPAPSGNFNLMLRVYGPEGRVADGSYLPPPVTSKPRVSGS